MSNQVNWFEIPAVDFERAVQFYATVFQGDLSVMNLEDRKMALMPPGANPEAGVNPIGSILHADNFKPSREGSIIYLDPMGSIDDALQRVEEAGGTITHPKQEIGAGYLACFTDTEGNTLGFVEWTV
jgi:predicted enzyme related to lactoylglutathione lyase